MPVENKTKAYHPLRCTINSLSACEPENR